MKPRGYRLIETRRGDTLQSVAARELGDAARWGEIVALNNLAPPYIVDTLADLQDAPAGKVLIAGQQIKLPAPPRKPSAVPVDDVFGTDLRLINGQLGVDEAAGGYATLADEANLQQALEHRLRTDPHELLWHPTYGCRARRLLGRRGGHGRAQLAAAYVERALRSDPRVSGIEEVLAGVDGDSLVVSAVAVAVDGKRLPVALGDEGE